MTTEYEVVVIVNPDLSDAGVQEQLEKIAQVITSNNGTVLSKQVWGRRRLSFKIKKKEHGIYLLFSIQGVGALVSTLTRQLNIMEDVLRHLIVERDKHAPANTPNILDDTPAFGDKEGLAGFEDFEGLRGDLAGDFTDVQ